MPFDEIGGDIQPPPAVHIQHLPSKRRKPPPLPPHHSQHRKWTPSVTSDMSIVDPLGDDPTAVGHKRGSASSNKSTSVVPIAREPVHPFSSGVSFEPEDVLEDTLSQRSSRSSRARREGSISTTAAASPRTYHAATLATLTAEDEEEHSSRSTWEDRRREQKISSPVDTIHAIEPPMLHDGNFDPSSPVPRVPPPPPPVKPSWTKLFTVLSWSDNLFYLFPAVAYSLAASAVQPYVTFVVGSAFTALATYPRDASKATPEQRAAFMHAVGSTSIKFAVVATIGIVLEYFKTVLWIRFSEKTTATLRLRIFDGVEEKPMKWFDLGMGMSEKEQETDKSNSQVAGDTVGAGGLMGKFTRETDEVRMALGLPSGNALQCLSSILACLLLAFIKQPLLALVILSSVPLLILLNTATQMVVAPMYSTERRAFAEASTQVERTTAAIATVKAFNAQNLESEAFTRMVYRASASLVKQAVVWATALGGTTFLTLSMFVVGFWYGAQIIAQGKATVGSVMTVFWACLLVSANLQQLIPLLVTMTKGKASLASLLTIIQDDGTSPSRPNVEPLSPLSPLSPKTAKSWVSSTRSSASTAVMTAGSRPSRCRGSFDFRDVGFAYPSRPDVKVLRGITLFLPEAETTFIVGGSGSGKSTIAQLLLRMYDPDAGEIELDNHDFSTLSIQYCRENIAAVQQGCILFDLSVHDNVALGLVGAGKNWLGKFRSPEDVTRDEVIEACKMAHIHDFIVSLQEGYETKLGTGGSQLSGGQRQRLAIARARIRNPTVLILDEATSALDATSRINVFEDIKKWRKNRTTIVITHDLSQIGPKDFTYVMKDGIVAEQGFRIDLMKHNGVFASMAKEQALQPLAPRADDTWHDASLVQDQIEADLNGPARQSFRASLRPASITSFYDLRNDYGGRPLSRQTHTPTGRSDELRRRRGSQALQPFGRAPSSYQAQQSDSRNQRRLSRAQKTLSWSEEDLKNGPYHIARTEPVSGQSVEKISVDDLKESHLESHSSTQSKTKRSLILAPFSICLSRRSQSSTQLSATRILKGWYPYIPDKELLIFGIVASVASGVCNPIWSFFMAKLISVVGAGDVSSVSRQGGVLIAICAAQGICEWLQHYTLNRAAATWTASIRDAAFKKVLAQDKGWFDGQANSPERLLHHLITDVHDMRHLVSNVLARVVQVTFMMGVALIWAVAVRWRLTLVSFAIAPIYIANLIFTSRTTATAENHNKSRREMVARTFYESVANVRGIRSMALESSFSKRFILESKEAQRSATSAAWTTSFGPAFAYCLPLFTQGLLNYVGAMFIRDGSMTYLAMLQVYTLVLFSLTFGNSLLGFMPILTKSKVASRDFQRLHDLSLDTVEKQGHQRYPIRGEIEFKAISFSYPTRPDVPVLTDFNLHLRPGECVAIVGPSGCGKSTIAGILQRLYEPTAGVVKLGDYYLHNAEVTWLRNHIGVVSQTANLFDASVAENISYGTNVGRAEIIRACKDANIHGFILGLPDGYDTKLGENASLISGGQAQRLQIARALVRSAAIHVFDECTSALDIENQRAILDTIVSLKETVTTIVITHSVEAMRRCDRIVCLDQGRVAEDGSFDELIARGGTFAKLMQTGEWE